VLNSINKKVMIGYAIVMLLLIVVSLLIFERSGKIGEKNAAFIQQSLPILRSTEVTVDKLSQVQIAAYALYGTTIELGQFRDQMAHYRKAIEQGITQLAALNRSNGDLNSQLQQVLNQVDQLERVMSASPVDWDGARVALTAMQQRVDQLREVLDGIKTDVEQQAESDAAAVQQQINAMRGLILAAIVGLAGIVMGAYIAAQKNISKPIKQLSLQLDTVVLEHDLSRSVDIKSRDEIGEAASSINELIDDFRKGTVGINQSSEAISDAVYQLNHSAATSEQQVEKFFHNIHELLNKISVLDDTIETSASRSLNASDMAKLGADQVKQGSSEVADTARSIADLSVDIESSAQMLLSLKNAGDQVSSVVKTIAEIAEQTNLLALNAAIEAARAGESGRGFAVVADEVRTLASRTHDSTHEINTILDQIVDSIANTVTQMESNKTKTNSVVKLAESTVTSLDAIQATVIELSNENQQLAQLAEVNRSHTTEMRGSVDQIQQASDHVREGSRETRDASANLSQLATSLNEIAARYKI